MSPEWRLRIGPPASRYPECMLNTWGTGSFENEIAAEFVKEVLEDGSAALEEALEVVLDPDLDDLEAEEGQRAVAAAEIVQIHLSGDTSSVSDAGLRAWLSELDAGELDDLRALALEALERVLGSASELPELWQNDADGQDGADTQGSAEWLAGMQRLRAGLSAGQDG